MRHVMPACSLDPCALPAAACWVLLGPPVVLQFNMKRWTMRSRVAAGWRPTDGSSLQGRHRDAIKGPQQQGMAASGWRKQPRVLFTRAPQEAGVSAVRCDG